MGSGGQRSVKRRATGGTVASATTQASTVAAAATSAASTGGGGAVSAFSKADVTSQQAIIASAQAKGPAGTYWAYDTPYQKFINNSGLDSKPELVDSATFDKTSGIEIYRTVNTNKTYSAAEVATKVAKDDAYLYNAGGGVVHGLGLYTTPDLSGSLAYGYNRDKNTAVMRFKIRDDAKIVNEMDLNSQFQADLQKAGTLAHKLNNNYEFSNALAMYAVSKGYSVVTGARGSDRKSIRKAMTNGGDYYTEILDRGALIMDSQTKMMTSKASRGYGKTWADLMDNHKIK